MQTTKPGNGAEVHLTISIRSRAATAWADAGHEVAWFQHQVSKGGPISLNKVPHASPDLKLDLAGPNVTVTGHNFTFVFDRTRGYLTGWTAGNVPLLESDPATGAAIMPSFWRPPTDNDRPTSLSYWKRFGIDALTSQLRSTRITGPEQSPGTASITFTTFLSPPVLDWGYLATTTYTISPAGHLTLAVHLVPSAGAGRPLPAHVPRAGLDLRLPRRLDAVRWFGLGPGESYPDKRAAQRVGVWAAESVADLHTPYEVPQEGGNRMGTRWVSVREPGAGGAGVRVITAGMAGEEWQGEGFSFRLGRYADRVVEAARHPCDLVEEEATLLRLDARVAGVGTGACGPAVREDLRVPVESMEFGFRLEAVGV